MDNFYRLSPEKIFNIENLISVHYFEYSKDFYFQGESHNFWEFLYVDKGTVTVKADSEDFSLKQGEIIFHKPNEFHAVSANGVAPNLIVISFDCVSDSMSYFNNKILSLSDREKLILSQIIAEARLAFSSPLGNPLINKLVASENAKIGAEQLVVNAIENLLVSLIRKESTKENLHIYGKENSFDKICQYLEDNIDKKLTIDTICKDNFIGASQLQKIFSDKTGGGVMNYFSKLKIQSAKYLLREGKYNFTEISLMLGYSSLHYFSRQFHKITSMSPSEYVLSVNALMDKHNI